jgi:hypothetical protein
MRRWQRRDDARSTTGSGTTGGLVRNHGQGARGRRFQNLRNGRCPRSPDPAQPRGWADLYLALEGGYREEYGRARLRCEPGSRRGGVCPLVCPNSPA